MNSFHDFVTENVAKIRSTIDPEIRFTFFPSRMKDLDLFCSSNGKQIAMPTEISIPIQTFFSNDVEDDGAFISDSLFHNNLFICTLEGCEKDIYVGTIVFVSNNRGMYCLPVRFVFTYSKKDLFSFAQSYKRFVRANKSSSVIDVEGATIKNFRKKDWGDIFTEDDFHLKIQADIESFFQNKAAYEKHGVTWKMGILLVGPPGNGKTAICKAAATSSKVPVIYFKFSGDVFYDLDSLDQTMAEYAPCMVIMEDADAMGSDADIRSKFLNILDGVAGTDGVLVIASTNAPEKLDEAITNRPSRFDYRYDVSPPCTAVRVAILSKVLACSNVLEEDIKKVAEKCKGFSGASVQEVAMYAVRRSLTENIPVSVSVLLDSVEKVKRHNVSSINKLDVPKLS